MQKVEHLYASAVDSQNHAGFDFIDVSCFLNFYDGCVFPCLALTSSFGCIIIYVYRL